MTALSAVFIAALTGCAVVSQSPDPAADAAAGGPAVTVEVSDVTDKAYTSAVGDVFAFYRDVADKTARGLSVRGVPASAYDGPDARRLTIQLESIRLDNYSGGSELRLRLRTQFSALIDGRRHSFSRDDQVQRASAGVSPADIRDVVSTVIAEEIVNDDDLVADARP